MENNTPDLVDYRFLMFGLLGRDSCDIPRMKWEYASADDKIDMLMRRGWNRDRARDFIFGCTEYEIWSAAFKQSRSFGFDATQRLLDRLNFESQMAAVLYGTPVPKPAPKPAPPRDTRSAIEQKIDAGIKAFSKAFVREYLAKAQQESEKKIVADAIAANRNSQKNDFITQQQIDQEIRNNWDSKYRFIATAFSRRVAALNAIKAARIASGELKV